MKKTFNFEEEQNQNEIEIKKNGQVHKFKIKDMYLKDQMRFASLKKLPEDEQVQFIMDFLDNKLDGEIVFSELELKSAEAMQILDWVMMIVSGQSEEEYERAKELANQRQTARPVASSGMADRAKAAIGEQAN